MSFQRLVGTSAIRSGYGKYRTAPENRGLTLQAQVLTDEYRHRDTIVVCDPLNCRLAFRGAEIRRPYKGEEAGSDGSYELGPSSGTPGAVLRAARRAGSLLARIHRHRADERLDQHPLPDRLVLHAGGL